MPTNAQYYPIAVEETQSQQNNNNSPDCDDKQKEGASNTGFFHNHKKTWARIVNAPSHAMQKLKKMHADFTGVGALYGSDHFAGRAATNKKY